MPPRTRFRGLARDVDTRCTYVHRAGVWAHAEEPASHPHRLLCPAAPLSLGYLAASAGVRGPQKGRVCLSCGWEWSLTWTWTGALRFSGRGLRPTLGWDPTVGEVVATVPWERVGVS